MKKTFLILFLISGVSFNYSQNITNTLGSNGIFSVKDGSSTFLTLNQSNGFLSLNKDLTLSHTTDSLLGVIYKGNVRFLHDYQAPGADGNNIFIGYNSGNFTMAGTGAAASYNIGIGTLTLSNNTSGFSNTAVGNYALLSNTTGNNNTAIGLNSMRINTEGVFNTALGAYSLFFNTGGNDNTAIGYATLGLNLTGSQNTAVGRESLTSNTYGIDNTAIGYRTLYYTTSANYNTAVGAKSLFSNTEGYNNTAVGFGSMYYNTTGIQNTALGYYALVANTTGNDNVAVGYEALQSNTTGYQNVAEGDLSLYGNTTGNSNTAVGFNSLTNNTVGFQNTALGHHSLQLNTSGNYNTAIGYNAGSTVTTGANLTLIGIDANPSSGSAFDEITLGNIYVQHLRCNVQTITSLSDRRDKKNIKDLTLGLDFLMKLRPREFNWDKRDWYQDGKSDGSKMQQTPTAGFIAQELDTAQANANAEWLNLVLKTNPDRLEATPGNLLPVIVKAIQEVKTEKDGEIAELKIKNEKLEIKNSSLEERLAKYEQIQATLVKELEQLKVNQQNFKVQIVKTEISNQ